MQKFEFGNQIDVIYTYFSNAFDMVNHNLSLAKLKLMGASSGVPQVFNLGPLLFFIIY